MSGLNNERIIKEGTYRTNLLLPWLTTDLSLTNRRFKGYDRNTLLGLIPLGKNEVTIPLKQIASVSTSTKFHIKRFLGGLFVTFLGLGSLSELGLMGIIWTLIGLGVLLNSYTSTLQITNNAGQKVPIQISILEKGNLQSFAGIVNDTVAEEVS
ncbi:hypothetical protein [Anaerosolibacter sp.]